MSLCQVLKSQLREIGFWQSSTKQVSRNHTANRSIVHFCMEQGDQENNNNCVLDIDIEFRKNSNKWTYIIGISLESERSQKRLPYSESQLDA